MKKTILITGGGRGIGAATARLLAQQGHAICINYASNQATAQAVVKDIQFAGGHAWCVAADVSQADQVQALFEFVDRECPPLHALVNNAGIVAPYARVEGMDLARFQRVFATNVTICGSVQALMIPPSHNAVIYSLAAGGTVSVAHLFLAGILPGLLFGLCLVGLVLWTSHKRDYPKGEPVALKDIPKIVTDALWGLVTIFIIMGGILSGVFTPTESAAVACVYAFLVTFLVYRDYKWSELPRMVHRVVKTVSMVMMLIGFSVAFGYMMTLMQIPAKITMFFLSISDNKYVFLFLVNLLLLLLGTFMDLAPMLLICTPIFMPVIAKLGIDPVHFGMIMILNLGIGLITPPVGPTLFVGCAVGKVTMEQVSKELWPFYGAMCVALLLVTYVPAISLWLPGLMK